jgi:hypothetical protein
MVRLSRRQEKVEETLALSLYGNANDIRRNPELTQVDSLYLKRIFV